MTRSSRLALVFLGVLLTIPAKTHAQLVQPTLHEDLAPPKDGNFLGPSPKPGRNPTAFVHGQSVVPEPAADQTPDPSEPIHGRGGFAADRTTEWRADYQTGPDATLQYVAVFNPSVVPFKRMSALNAIREDFTLYANPSARRELGISAETGQGREQFWGSLMVELQTGVDVPIPSVAPGMRILSYEIQPTTELWFSKDSSDNYFVRSEDTGVTGLHRLIFLVDAGENYFAANVPKGYQIRTMAKLREGKPRIPAIPESVRNTAHKVLNVLGIRRNTSLEHAFDTLVVYFRGFSAKPIQTPTGNIYWDLFDSQAGVCRHRSFAFMITANVLGIPTRYVTNEAHAWVESWIPEQGWTRIDLGGAAQRMDVRNASEKQIHPNRPDPFPKPESYANNYTQLRGDVRGLSERQRQQRRQGPHTPSSDLDVNPDTVDTSQEQSNIDPTASAEPEITAIVDRTDRIGFRGEQVSVTGRALGIETAGIAIQLYLSAINGDEQLIAAGSAQTDTSGNFSTTIVIPASLPVGDYEVLAETQIRRENQP